MKIIEKIITFILFFLFFTTVGCVDQDNDYQDIDIDSESIQEAYQNAVTPVINWLDEQKKSGQPYPNRLPESYQSYLDIIKPIATYRYYSDDVYEIRIFDYKDYGFHYTYSNIDKQWGLDK